MRTFIGKYLELGAELYGTYTERLQGFSQWIDCPLFLPTCVRQGLWDTLTLSESYGDSKLNHYLEWDWQLVYPRVIFDGEQLGPGSKNFGGRIWRVESGTGKSRIVENMVN